MPNEYPDGSLEDAPSSPSTDALLEDLRAAGVAFDTAASVRADHGRDWWPLTIPDVARGHVPRVARRRRAADVELRKSAECWSSLRTIAWR